MKARICRAKSMLLVFKDALILIIKKLLPSICPGMERGSGRAQGCPEPGLLLLAALPGGSQSSDQPPAPTG